MGWISINQYIQEAGLSDSTIRRRIRSGKLKSKKIGSKWSIWADQGKVGRAPQQFHDDKTQPDRMRKSVAVSHENEWQSPGRKWSGKTVNNIESSHYDKTEPVGGIAYSVEKPHFSFPKSMEKENGGSISEIIEFSSKALNSYLITNDRLVNEKDKRIEEKEELIKSQRQRIAELEYYIKTLENLERKLREEREKPEGWK